jgi:hypothetical protein
MERKVFRSKVSVLLCLFFLSVMLPILVVIIRAGSIFNPAFYTVAGTFILIFFLFCGIRYEFNDSKLSVRMCGIKYFTVPVSAIISVERSYNPLSAPAASLKRLCLRFKKGYKWPYMLISPANEAEFLSCLQEINPDIYIRVNSKKAWYRIWDWDI